MQTLNPNNHEEEYFPSATHCDYDFAYQICVADDHHDLDLDLIPTKKRKSRHDDDWKVSIVWKVIRSFYCSDDRTRPIVDVDFKTATFRDMEFWLFTETDENGVGVIDRMLTVIGRIVEDGVPFNDVEEMIAQIRRVVCAAVRSGRRKENLDMMVTVRNQSGLPRREYEAMNSFDKISINTRFQCC
ncbi:uncharacterized protein LOC112202196 [Rosa chinensis]|uniref:uncharacterized protein LOC112202196 n=1 Tax=Rosa chinensis TaxID=74649 RepID=UPI000D09217C|nr:uncharacterized protein LOC112202196 [Rosa chinensis]